MKVNLLLKEGFDSMHLFEKINVLEKPSITSFENGVDWILNNNIDFVLVGGTAVVHYLKKGRDLTPDIDLLVKDIDICKNKLEDDGIFYESLINEQGNDIGVTIPDFNIDLLKKINSKQGFNNLIFKTAKNINFGGANIKIISIELLAILKLDLGREKDLNDAFMLIKSPEFNKNKFNILADATKNILTDYESIKMYSEL